MTYRLIDPEAPERNLEITIDEDGRVLEIKEEYGTRENKHSDCNT